MRRVIGFLALAFALALPVAGDVPARVESVHLAVAFDLDGEGADADQVIEAVAIIDDGSVSGTDYTIAAQPDTCRLLDLTIVDTDLSAGSITVTGTDCWGAPLVSTFAFTAGDDTGVQTLTVSSGQATGAYYKTVTEVATGTMTGESDETMALGYAGDATPAQYVLYGVERYSFTGPIGTNPGRWVDVFGTYEVNQEVHTAGVASTTLAALDTTNDTPFQNVAVGDILLLRQNSYTVARLVTARASATSITLNASVNIGDTSSETGQTFSFKRRYVLADPQDGWIPVQGWDALVYLLDVDATANTGGVVSDVTCAALGPTYEPQVQIDTATVASGATGEDTTAIDLRLAPWITHCRFGLEFGTNDDADAADEDINLVIGFRK
jgi:hypothetical protein